MVAEPHSIMYDTHHAGGMQEEHAYATAAAALVDQVDRALSAPPHSAARRIVEAAIQETVLRLGGRPSNYLEWHPEWLAEHLREDNILEAYLLARIRAKRRARETGTAYESEATQRWRQLEKGTPLWETGTVTDDDGNRHSMPPAPFAREIAAMEVAHWEDLTHADGSMMKYKQMCANLGLRDGREVDDRVRKLYHNVRAHAASIRHIWKRGELGSNSGRGKLEGRRRRTNRASVNRLRIAV